MTNSVCDEWEFQYYENSKVEKSKKKIKEKKNSAQKIPGLDKEKHCWEKVCCSDAADMELSLLTIKAQKMVKTQGAAAAAAATGSNECAVCKAVKRPAFKCAALFSPDFCALNGFCAGCQQAYKSRMMKKEMKAASAASAAASAASAASASAAAAAADNAKSKKKAKKASFLGKKWSASVGCSSDGYKGAAAACLAENAPPHVDEGLVGSVIIGGQYGRRAGSQLYSEN